MKTGFAGILAIGLAFLVIRGPAATLYVDWSSTNAVPPYADWNTAATNIQDAIDASTNGDLILVTNGIYAVGGKSMDGVITNRVSLDKAVTVQSVNGPFVTVIQGAGMSNGVSAVRCAWLTNNAALVGFTLEWGGTRILQNNGGRGGGVWCWSSNAVLANCLIVSNIAYQFGGGIYQGTLNNCFIGDNSAQQIGSGSYGANLTSCTIVSNNNGAFSRVGVAGGSLTNCIVYYNAGGNFSGGTFSYCCTTPLASGVGNFTNPPQLFVDGIHLSSASPCISAGTNATTGTDIFGEPWGNPPSIGCAEWQPEPVVMPLQLQLTGVPVGFSISPLALNGQPPFSFQWLTDGVPVQDDGHFSGSQTTNLIALGIKFSDAGSYQLVASNAFGMVTSAVAQLVIHCVDAAGSDPQPPFTNWADAATNVQDAIDAAVAGEIVLVTNGVYSTGGRVMASGSSNRVVLDKPLTVVSVNGYSATTIEGAWDAVSTNGPAAVRCAWLTNGAVLSGFTLENGATQTSSDNIGGGVFCTSSNAVVANCELTNNSAIYGGGASSGTLNNCLVIGNIASFGGGAYSAILNNCTVVGNYSTASSLDATAAGTYAGSVRNSIVQDNLSLAPFYYFQPNNYYPSLSPPNYLYSDSYPLISGSGNPGDISSDPQFLDAFHIASTSPCRGAGSPLYAGGSDLDGEAWANPPSMGCDEVVLSNLTGPLSVNVQIPPYQTNVLVNRYADFDGFINGRAAYVTWSFGDGPTFTNFGVESFHQWTNAGHYAIIFTAYNNDHPAGVSADTNFSVVPLIAPQLQSPVLGTNGFQFQFPGQWNANYTIQYAPNLISPVNWQTLQNIYYNSDSLIQISDSSPTNAARFYRVLAQ